MPERWLSVPEIAEHLGVSKETIYKWVAKKTIPSHKIGKFRKFRITEVDEWVTSGKGKKEKN